jgi:CrcB protein
MFKLTVIFLGSGIGGVLRYGLGGWVQRMLGLTFPFGTLAVNVVGCLLIGFLGAGFAERLFVREDYRVAVLVGVLGGFTTFSAFEFETFVLISSGHYYRAVGNVVLSLGLGLMAVWMGYRVAESWLGA